MQGGSSLDSPSLYSGNASMNLETALQRGTRQAGGLALKVHQVGTTRKQDWVGALEYLTAHDADFKGKHDLEQSGSQKNWSLLPNLYRMTRAITSRYSAVTYAFLCNNASMMRIFITFTISI